MSSNTTGGSNVAMGTNALTNNTTGVENTALGYKALEANTTAQQNVALGRLALLSNTTGNSNVAVGSAALDANTTAHYNTAVGQAALGANTTGQWNTAFGYNSADSITTAHKNSAYGSYALHVNTTGTDNTCLGYAAGDTISTGSTNICIGSISDVSTGVASGQIAIGYNVTCTANATVTIGYGSDKASLSLDGSDTSWAATSDIRLKDNVEDSLAGLDFINELRPVTYKWKAKKDVPSDMPEYDDGSDEPCKGTGKTNHGFVAQEVKAVIDKYDSIKDGHNIWKEEDSGTQTLAPSALMPMMVKAVQELSAEVQELKKQLENK
jgi:hypothetical protein